MARLAARPLKGRAMVTKPASAGFPARAARRRKRASSSFLEDRLRGLRTHSPPLQGPGAACLALHLTPASERGGEEARRGSRALWCLKPLPARGGAAAT